MVGDGRIFYSSGYGTGYGTGAVVFELTTNGDRFQTREVWRNIRMKNRQSTPVVHSGFIYGLDEGILACIDASTGDLKWKAGRYGHGQVLLVGDRLLISTEDGTLVLVQATPDTLKPLLRLPTHLALEGRAVALGVGSNVIPDWEYGIHWQSEYRQASGSEPTRVRGGTDQRQRGEPTNASKRTD